MEEYNVVPDIISEVPPGKVTVTYGEISVNLGNELTPTQVFDKPQVSWDAEENSFYTLIMTDPDIPPNLGATEVQHWLVVNIPGNNVAKGETIFEYVGSGPPQGSGLHRYIFLILKQNGTLPETAYSNLKDGRLGLLPTRKNNNINDLMNQLQLSQIVAANFYRAQYDDNVPAFRERLLKLYT